MKKRSLKINNAVKYVIFSIILLLLFYFIPRPDYQDEKVVFEISREHEAAHIEQSKLKPKEKGTNESEVFSAGNSFEEEKYGEEEIDEEEMEEVTLASDASENIHENTKPDTQKQPEKEDRKFDAPVIPEKTTDNFTPKGSLSKRPFEELENEKGLNDTEYFRKFVQIYSDQKLRGVKPETRTDVVIRYYVKEKDADRVFSLRQLGFYIHERPTSEAFQGLSSNAIYYGSEVSLVDIKMVAYTLLRKGVELKVIEPSKFSTDWKVRSIEVGADDSKVDFPIITLSDIRKLTL